MACFVRAGSGEEFCLPPLPVDDLGTIVKPVDAEAQLNRVDLCGFYFVPYDTLETIEAELVSLTPTPLTLTLTLTLTLALALTPTLTLTLTLTMARPAATHAQHSPHSRVCAPTESG